MFLEKLYPLYQITTLNHYVTAIVPPNGASLHTLAFSPFSYPDAQTFTLLPTSYNLVSFSYTLTRFKACVILREWIAIREVDGIQG